MAEFEELAELDELLGDVLRRPYARQIGDPVYGVVMGRTLPVKLRQHRARYVLSRCAAGFAHTYWWHTLPVTNHT